MPDQLVRDAIEQSRTREPLVNAMALLSGARILAYIDLAAAKRALAEGLSVFDGVPDIFNLHEAVLLAVPVDPEIAVSRYKQMDTSRPHHFDGRTLISQLATHGFASIALDLLEDLRYPVEGGLPLIAASQDPMFQLRVLRAAKARWRMPRHFLVSDDFHRLFSRNFRILDPVEASVWLDELLEHAKTLSTDRIGARFGEDIEFQTFADMHVFELLHTARALKSAPFVEGLLRQYPAVAAAAEVYPNGTESIVRTPPPPRPTTGKSSIALSPSISIEHLLDEAHHTFIDDVNNNAAPRAFWPATQAYRLALYWAGQRYGKDGQRYLQSVPDTDIAILAVIELAGGILDLPMRQGSKRHAPYRSVSRPSEPGVPVT
jgi:hypothetical protein